MLLLAVAASSAGAGAVVAVAAGGVDMLASVTALIRMSPHPVAQLAGIASALCADLQLLHDGLEADRGRFRK